MTLNDIVQPPAGIRPPLANVMVVRPAVAVMTLVTVVLATQAPELRAGVAATVMPVGNWSVNVLFNQMGAVLLLAILMNSVVVLAVREAYVGEKDLVTLGLAGATTQLPMSVMV